MEGNGLKAIIMCGLTKTNNANGKINMLNSLQITGNVRRYTDSLPQGSAFVVVYDNIGSDNKPFAQEHEQVRGTRNVEIVS